MYVPKQFRNTDASTITDFIRHHGFGILVSQADSRMVATHIPLELSEDETKLTGHIARANPQWKNFDNDAEVMIIFPGPHAYVSSSWYDHENVPTWNYIAVHVYGKIKIIEGEVLYSALKHLMDKYERTSEHPVSVEKMSPEYVRQSIKGLVGFEVNITSIEAAYKLSQNRDRKNFANVINELEKRGDHDSKSIAAEMKKIEKQKS
jgi:transcriptional regulator